MSTGGDFTRPPSSGSTPPPSGGAAGGGDLIQPGTPPKDPVIVLVLNLILLCVGYFYLGQWQKGLVALCAGLVIGIFTCGVGSLAIAIAAAFDGYYQAQQLQAGRPVAQWTFFQDHR